MKRYEIIFRYNVNHGSTNYSVIMTGKSKADALYDFRFDYGKDPKVVSVKEVNG